MRIVSLTAENIKRIKAVEITPDGDVVTITGRNAQGKSSVLDAIWLALGGGTAAKTTTRPIRDGEDTARVVLDLGTLVVTRTWRGDRTTLTVTSEDGAKFSSPQGMLDALVGSLSFDPLAFTRLSARDQRAALLDLVDLGFDVDAADELRARRFAERTEVGRQVKAIGEVTVDESLPTEETSASEVIAKIRAAEEHNRAVREASTLARDMHAGQESQKRAISQMEAELADARVALERQAAAVAEQDRLVETMRERDTRALEALLATVEETNARVRANNDAKAHRDRKRQLRGQYDDLTEEIAGIDQQKADALEAAAFPVAGLGFDETGVTYQGVPFSQASSAEQIRVSLAMAMSLNPTLRVIRILDGSLLDADNLALIEDMAREHDCQVWIERVSDPSESAVVIEDGEVVS